MRVLLSIALLVLAVLPFVASNIPTQPSDCPNLSYALVFALQEQQMNMKEGSQAAIKYGTGVTLTPAFNSCPVAYVPKSSTPAIDLCCSTYADLFQGASGTLEIAVFSSYFNSDVEPMYVMDKSLNDELHSELTQSCASSSQTWTACGFQDTQSSDSATYTLTKSVTGPDGNPATVNIRIYSGSYCIADQENNPHTNGEKASEQAQSTTTVQNAFTNALSNADVVLYLGHSRNGGGPDFSPPVLTTAGTTNYPWYEKNKPGVTFLLNALQNRTPGRLKLLGLFSCMSDGHFLASLKQTASEIGIIGSQQLVGDNQMTGSALGAISSLLSFSCQHRFTELMNPPALVKGTQFELTGLFVSHASASGAIDADQGDGEGEHLFSHEVEGGQLEGRHRRTHNEGVRVRVDVDVE